MNEFPYWLTTVDQPASSSTFRVSSSEFSVPRSVDAVVVGGGYTGLAAARRLAKAGASVVVFERECIGWGASSRNGGQVLSGLRLDAATLVARYGETQARVLFDAASASIDHLEQLIDDEAIDCEYERSGHIQAAFKASHFESFRAEQSLLARVFDHRVEILSRAEQRREIGSDIYHGVLVDERSGALNPARYVRGLAGAAARTGACIVERTPVLSITHDAGRWRVATPRGETSAAHVMAATNGYTDGVVPALRRRLVPIGSYIVATEPLAPELARDILPARRMAFDSKHFLYYFRLTADRRLLFGGRAEFSQPDAGATRRAARILRQGMVTVFPQLERVAIEYAWGGNVAFTRDELPHGGQLEGMFFAGGYCGHGIALATTLGDVVGRRVAGERVEHPLLDRAFPPIPLYRGRPWFLPLAGAYYRVMDWLT